MSRNILDVDHDGATVIPIDTARILIVDPCSLPDALVEELTTVGPDGFAEAVLIDTHCDLVLDVVIDRGWIRLPNATFGLEDDEGDE